MTCPFCTQAVGDDFQFCPTCGTPLAVNPAAAAGGIPVRVLEAPVGSRTSGKAIGSLVCGISWFGGLGSVAALFLGYLALREIRRDPARVLGRGMAIAGIILGWIGVAGLAFVITVGIQVWNEPRRPERKPHLRQTHMTVARGHRTSGQSAAVEASAAARFDRPGSLVMTSQQLRSASSLLTNWVCNACPALRASTRPSKGKPTSAKSPIRSSALCRPNSSS